ncbi:MAG: DUF2953 domain-containing protein [Dethiobacter sp.]|jgi:hypothetical protein|nr:DUF2953 domain-containing protein [Dethiobacter sp.]
MIYTIKEKVRENARGGEMALILQLSPFYFVIWFLMLLIPVRINLFLQRENKDDFIALRVNTFFSLLRFQVEVPFLKQTAPLDLTLEAETKAGEDELIREKRGKVSIFDISLEELAEYLAYIEKNRQLLWFIARFLARAVTVEFLNLRVEGGTADAAQTGILYGLYWSTVGSLTRLAEKLLKFRKRPLISANPDFSHNPVIKVRLDTTVSFRIGHFSLVGLILLAAKIRKGDENKWKAILSRV